MTKIISSTVLRQKSKMVELIMELQNGLIDLGYDVGSDGADGEFGINTYNAVCSFQLEHGLEADGEFGPLSWTALYEALGYEVQNPVYPETISNINDLSIGDEISLVSGATYLNGEKIPAWLFKVPLYICKINNANSISVSLNKSGTAAGNVAPNFVKLKKAKNTDNVVIDNSGAINLFNGTTSYTASKLIEIAKKEIGYKEKNSNYNLDEANANAGSGNYTKYARDLYEAGYYGGGNKNGYAWCDVFVDWCFYQLTNKNREKAEYLQCQTGDGGAGCAYSAQYYKQAGQWSENPQIGSQVFFYYNGDINHTGIVININNSIIQTIEGNSSDQVIQRQYPIGYSSIAGYGIPRYNNTISESIKVQITANRLNVREQPSADSQILSVVNKGQIFEITEQEGVYGKTSDGGWIDLSYVKKYE